MQDHLAADSQTDPWQTQRRIEESFSRASEEVHPVPWFLRAQPCLALT